MAPPGISCASGKIRESPRAFGTILAYAHFSLRQCGSSEGELHMADYFDTRTAVPRPVTTEAALKLWAKAGPTRTVKPGILKITGRIEHVFTCKEGGEVVATGRGQTPVGASRDACTQLGI
jgi:hypothetical protein